MTNKRWFTLGAIGLAFILWLDTSTPDIVLTLQEPTITHAQISDTRKLNSISADRIIDLVNADRRAVGLVEVRANATLNSVAQEKAGRYARADHFGHPDVDGSLIWEHLRAAGYDYSDAGENLARVAEDRTSDELILLWEESPTHYRNFVESEFRDIGIGIAEGIHDGQKAIWVVQLFGRRQ